MGDEIFIHFMEVFSDVPDPRKHLGRNKHNLFSIIFIAIAAIVCGADDWQTIALWATAQKEWLGKYCALDNGIPSWWTFRRVFRILDPKAMQFAFVKWMKRIQPEAGTVLAIDGKTLRRTFDRKDGTGAIHVVSAWAAANHVVLGQCKVDDKSNEITAIPELLDLLSIKGLTVTMDAMGCQKEIVAQIVGKGANYVLAVKGNQANLHADIQKVFSNALDSNAVQPDYQTNEKGHGREETRMYYLSDALSGIRNANDWRFLTCIGMVVTQRRIGTEESGEIRYFITNLKKEGKKFANAVRDHWGVENGLHWVLDVAFDEDRNRTRKENSAENFSTIRRVSLNLLKEFPMKCGIKAKRLLAAIDCKIREKILKI